MVKWGCSYIWGVTFCHCVACFEWQNDDIFYLTLDKVYFYSSIMEHIQYNLIQYCTLTCYKLNLEAVSDMFVFISKVILDAVICCVVLLYWTAVC